MILPPELGLNDKLAVSHLVSSCTQQSCPLYIFDLRARIFSRLGLGGRLVNVYVCCVRVCVYGICLCAKDTLCVLHCVKHYNS